MFIYGLRVETKMTAAWTETFSKQISFNPYFLHPSFTNTPSLESSYHPCISFTEDHGGCTVKQKHLPQLSQQLCQYPPFKGFKRFWRIFWHFLAKNDRHPVRKYCRVFCQPNFRTNVKFTKASIFAFKKIISHLSEICLVLLHSDRLSL